MPLLFVTAKGRSGSTLLDNLLGGFDGFFSGGEIHHLWDWGLEHGVPCGCGQPVTACPTWSPVLDKVGPATKDAGAAQRAALGWRALLAPRDAAASFARLTLDLYRALADVTGAEVIVDASKVPWHPAVRALIPGLDVRVIHLVRDPRAVAFSWRRAKPMRGSGPGETMPVWGAARSAFSWLLRNLAAERARRRHPPAHWMTLRYEDLVAAPAATLRRILAFAGRPDASLPTADGITFELGVNHTVGGNPDRSDRTTVTVAADDEWKTRQRSWDRWITTVVTGPLLRRYGYSLRVR